MCPSCVSFVPRQSYDFARLCLGVPKQIAPDFFKLHAIKTLVGPTRAIGTDLPYRSVVDPLAVEPVIERVVCQRGPKPVPHFLQSLYKLAGPEPIGLSLLKGVEDVAIELELRIEARLLDRNGGSRHRRAITQRISDRDQHAVVVGTTATQLLRQ